MVTLMKGRRCLAGLVASCSLAVDCASDGSLDRQKAGAITGAIVGAVVGSNLGDDEALAILGGAALGAFVGSRFGAYLDDRDRLAQAEATAAAVDAPEATATVPWHNPDSGVSGTVTAGPPVAVPVVTEPGVAEPGKPGQDSAVRPAEREPAPEPPTLTGTCRDVVRTVLLPAGQEAREQVRYCKASDGRWVAA